METLSINEVPWESLIGFYNSGDFVLEKLSILGKGSLKEEQEALDKIEMEIEHQGTISAIAPFALYFLIYTFKSKHEKVNKRIELFLEELKAVIVDYFEMVGGEEGGKQHYTFGMFLGLVEKYVQQNKNIWDSDDLESYFIANKLVEALIANYEAKTI